ncbi:MAG: hypothetical protein U9O78_03305 [Patescibacteria group bacterium]|nr:hypothetical protein [Patescibacteria group bacterium]
MSQLFDPVLEKTLIKDKKYLEQTTIPIITVSSTYQEDLKGFYNLPEIDTSNDIVFSRAHYSMALATAVQAWGEKINPKKAWVVDPTNYVKADDWLSIQLTEKIGKTLARLPILKRLKDLVDKFGRKKLPILDSIGPPLAYLTQNIKKPILSFHIATGNILIEQNKTIFQMVTDPHIREDYLLHADNPRLTYLVFDQNTKTELLEKANLMDKAVDPNQVIVTGPPVDPRIIAARKQKQPWRSGQLKLCLTTGGLGTNKPEIKTLLNQLLPELRKRPSPYQLMVYAGTHNDIAQLVKKMAREKRVAVNEIHPKDPAKFKQRAKVSSPRKNHVNKELKDKKLTLIYHPQIVDANELLIRYGFPWADGFISKPSGDMAYDAVASGSFLLTLKEWGEWEHNIREIFEQKSISRRANIDNIVTQLETLRAAQGKSQSWIEQAMNHALSIDKLFIKGVKNILKAVK